jgi:hypothetical protein
MIARNEEGLGCKAKRLVADTGYAPARPTSRRRRCHVQTEPHIRWQVTD